MRVKLENLEKSYTENNMILKAINFSDDIHSMAIIGPSGCGKSTLLRVIGGLIPKTSGECIIGNHRLPQKENDLISYRKNIGFVFQHSGLFNHLTALQNITLPLIKVHGYNEPDAIKVAMSLLDRLGVHNEATKKPLSLSGGQRQRIAIARAIAPKPELLLFDEPTSALDPGYTSEVLKVIKELKSEGMDFIIVTHHMGFARHACDTLAFMNKGKIDSYGNSNTLFDHQESPALKSFLSGILEWSI